MAKSKGERKKEKMCELREKERFFSLLFLQLEANRENSILRAYSTQTGFHIFQYEYAPPGFVIH